MSVHTIRANAAEHPYLLVTAGDVQCALPLAQVAEISRTPQGDLPTSIVLRGREMRLFDLTAMLGVANAAKKRVVRLQLNQGREAALAVSEVPGTRMFEPSQFSPLEISPEASNTPYPEATDIYNDILNMLHAGGRLPESVIATVQGRD